VLLDTFKPTFLIQIEGDTLSKDITQEITEFVYEDHEEELDVMELSITNRNLQFTDDPLFQEGNEIVARFGYVDVALAAEDRGHQGHRLRLPGVGRSRRSASRPTTRAFKLAGKENQKIWQKPAPGILYSEIAEEIAAANALIPVVTPNREDHLY